MTPVMAAGALAPMSWVPVTLTTLTATTTATQTPSTTPTLTTLTSATTTVVAEATVAMRRAVRRTPRFAPAASVPTTQALTPTPLTARTDPYRQRRPTP